MHAFVDEFYYQQKRQQVVYGVIYFINGIKYFFLHIKANNKAVSSSL